MKGEIFNIYEDFVVDQYGRDSFEDHLTECKEALVTKEPFVGPATYPDSDLLVMLEKGCARFRLSLPILLKNLGRFTFAKLADKLPNFRERFPDAKSVLIGLNDMIHVEARKLYRDAQPPVFVVQEISANKLSLTYVSKRKLYDLVDGLLLGLADYYGIKIEVKKILLDEASTKTCMFEIDFGRAI